MGGTRALSQVDGVDWAAAAMATPANVDTLVEEGFDRAALDGSSADDLFVAVRASDDEAADRAVAAGEEVLFAARRAAPSGAAAERPVRTIEEAVDLQSGTNVAIVSVPGDYATLEAHKALSAGLHVLLFSDNVSVADEVELKDRATALGRLVMGPGAGTAMLGGTGLGFANVVGARGGRARVGVVAAAGTGAQEAMSLLDRWGATVTDVIGLGGRDLSDAVDGRMAKLAVAALRDDPGTDAILLVSKPPSERVARAVLDVARAGSTPVRGRHGGPRRRAARLRRARPADARAGGHGRPGRGRAGGPRRRRRPGGRGGRSPAPASARAARLVRGLFSGGTLCYESLRDPRPACSGRCGRTRPSTSAYEVPAPDGAHVCLDLGEEEYTKGRPHPMIDPAARIELDPRGGRPSRRGRGAPRRGARPRVPPRPRGRAGAGVR